MMLKPPAYIRTDSSNPFAHHSMSVRVPNTIRETQQHNADYPLLIQDALDRLHDEILFDAPIGRLTLPASDFASWMASLDAHAGETWLHSYWFHTETYFYRRLLEAVRWLETGRDPFAPQKNAEFASAALWHTLDEALAARALSPEERLGALIEFDLWGNRIDLSYALAASHGAKASQEDLLVDDGAAVVEHLMRTNAPVHLVCDNCGTELAMDCTLVDALLERGHEVWMHVKAHPFFVSDTLVADIHQFWGLLAHRGGESRALGERLIGAFESGRLRLLPNHFWCSDQPLHALPDYLHAVFAQAALVILKGDLNYRRACSDGDWPHTTPFEQVTSYFPAPLAALRTLKSDIIVGLPAGLETTLQAADAQWRVNGKRGLIQFKA